MDGDVEEERRLFYVAVTRAMDRVYYHEREFEERLQNFPTKAESFSI